MLALDTPLGLALLIADAGLAAALYRGRVVLPDDRSTIRQALTAVRCARWPDANDEQRLVALRRAVEVLREFGRTAEVEEIEQQLVAEARR